MAKNNRIESFKRMELRKDSKGAEYLYFCSAFGPVHDYSPWTIEEYKQARDSGLLGGVTC